MGILTGKPFASVVWENLISPILEIFGYVLQRYHLVIIPVILNKYEHICLTLPHSNTRCRQNVVCSTWSPHLTSAISINFQHHGLNIPMKMDWWGFMTMTNGFIAPKLCNLPSIFPCPTPTDRTWRPWSHLPWGHSMVLGRPSSHMPRKTWSWTMIFRNLPCVLPSALHCSCFFCHTPCCF